jgi:2-C-methyl-D-erythritol 4-phosphate cytidylyltransferase
MDEIYKSAGRPRGAVAVIPAAGAGVRMGGERAKQFLELDGLPLLAITLARFQAAASVESIILVVSAGEIDFCRREVVARFKLDKVQKVVAGGERRQDSVRRGIEATDGRFDLILIHDGVRPLVQTDLIERVIGVGRKHGAAIAALPTKDTVKEVDSEGIVTRTYDRRRVWLVQTPQVFRYEDIRAAHQKAAQEGWTELTDDALLAERMGIPVAVVEGSEDNIKITTPYDLELAAFLLRRRTG